MKHLPQTEIESVIRPGDGFIAELHDHSLVINRVKVPGGWVLVCSTYVVYEISDGNDERHSVSTSAVFVSDPEHKWLDAQCAADSRGA